MTDQKQAQKGQINPSDLAKALGTQTPPVPASVPKPDAPKTVTKLDKYLSGLPEALQKQVMSLPEAFRVDIAEGYFKLQHPEGLQSEFKIKVLEAIRQIAKDCMISVDGQEVLARFPVGEGTVQTAEFVAVGTYQAKTAKGSGGKGGGGEKREWGECTVTDENGKVKAYDNPSAMAKGLGLRITGHTDQLHTFSHPKKAEGLAWEKNYKTPACSGDNKTITVVTGDLDNPALGIHVKLS